jgi:hypothetical protein
MDLPLSRSYAVKSTKMRIDAWSMTAPMDDIRARFEYGCDDKIPAALFLAAGHCGLIGARPEVRTA